MQSLRHSLITGLLPALLGAMTSQAIGATPGLRDIFIRLLDPDPLPARFIRTRRTAGIVQHYQSAKKEKVSIHLRLFRGRAEAEAFFRQRRDHANQQGFQVRSISVRGAPAMLVNHRRHRDSLSLFAHGDWWFLGIGLVDRSTDRAFSATLQSFAQGQASTLVGRLQAMSNPYTGPAPAPADKGIALLQFVATAVREELLPVGFLTPAARTAKVVFADLSGGAVAMFSPSANTLTLARQLERDGKLKPFDKIGISARATILHELWHAYWNWEKRHGTANTFRSFMQRIDCRYSRVELDSLGERGRPPAFADLSTQQRADLLEETLAAYFGQFTRNWMSYRASAPSSSRQALQAYLARMTKTWLDEQSITAYYYDITFVGGRGKKRLVAKSAALSAFEAHEYARLLGLLPAPLLRQHLGTPTAPDCYDPTPAPAPTPEQQPSPRQAPAPAPPPVGGPRNINDMLGPRGW